ncbi:hypothetical protein [uncultured Flavobacterium sp.]|uniref:hypothetical protein n=1 Tax=uncultured Flavobacterium sp. TaxID=165435 RepID=UPI0025F9F0AC|nr:hypothetical protein [uncultured Flavobacterium sp.]
MKHLILKLILPLTLFSFVLITKWAYVLPEDAPADMLFGFPLPYRCSGWHTSLSTQFFIAEMVFDLLVYFVFWLFLISFINRLVSLKPGRAIVVATWLIAVLSLCLPLIMPPNPTMYLKPEGILNTAK